MGLQRGHKGHPIGRWRGAWLSLRGPLVESVSHLCRAEIRDRAVDLRDRTTETVKDTVSQAKTKAYEIKDTVTDTVREKAEELKQRGKHAVSRKLDDVSDAAETGKKKVSEY